AAGLVFSLAMIITNSRRLTEVIMVISGSMVIWFFSVVEPPEVQDLYIPSPGTPTEIRRDTTQPAMQNP
ncbi:MAG TPA: hypothetical protein DCE41_08335, partial [Cytophagales bacterium]|nr:hypothetical protein [Cytophagales bacterium]